MENNMDEVVCGCYNVTRKAIVDAVNAGARTFEEVQKATKIGEGCGGCIEEAKQIVQEILKNVSR